MTKTQRIFKAGAALLSLATLGWLAPSCGTGIDFNGKYADLCNGSRWDATVWTGTKIIGLAGKAVNGAYIATDASSALLVTGTTEGSLDEATITGSFDLFVTKYDHSGVRQWTQLLGAASSTTISRTITTDSSANVWVAGSTTGALNDNTRTGTRDGFVTKYNSAGARQWTRQYGVAGKSYEATGIAADSSGNVYVTDATSDPIHGATPTGSTDAVLIKYDASGTRQWTVLSGTASKTASAQAVATQGSSVYVVGRTDGGFGSETVTGTGTNIFVAKYDATTGARQWVRLLGAATGNLQPRSVQLDSSGGIYAAGYSDGSIGTLTKTGTRDYFLAKYDNTGVFQWVKQAGVASVATEATGLTIDARDGVHVMGITKGGLGGNTLKGTQDGFVANFDTSGTLKSTRQFGNTGTLIEGTRIASDCTSTLYAAGTVTGALDGISAIGSSDTYVKSFSAD